MLFRGQFTHCAMTILLSLILLPYSSILLKQGVNLIAWYGFCLLHQQWHDVFACTLLIIINFKIIALDK